MIIKIWDTFQKDTSSGAFLKYTSDTLSGWKWAWHWEKGYDGKYSLSSLHPLCSRCDTPLVQDNDDWLLIKCPRCPFSIRNKLPDDESIKTVIYDNVKRNLFKNEDS